MKLIVVIDLRENALHIRYILPKMMDIAPVV